MALSVSGIIEDVKLLLNIDGTTEFDSKASLLIAAAFSKLETEGVPNTLDIAHKYYADYLVCVASYVAKDFDADTSSSRFGVDRLTRDSFTRVATLKRAVDYPR